MEDSLFKQKKMTQSDPILGYAYKNPSNVGFTSTFHTYLVQISDIFSEFDKYIAPAYYHDRCERSVQMRLYTMHKREYVMVFVMFFACLGLLTFIGIAGPPITQMSHLNGIDLLPKNNTTNEGHNRKDMATGPYIMKTPRLTAYNQQLWVIAEIKTGSRDDESIDREFDIGVTLSGLTEEHKPVPLVTLSDHKNRSRHLHCDESTCDEFIVLHMGYMEYHHYIINVVFYNLESFHSRYNIKELTFYYKTYNPDFTQIEVWFRLIFLVSAFIIAVSLLRPAINRLSNTWFYQRLRKFPVHCWALEQKWVGILLPLLMAFNNPIFPMIFITNTSVPGLLDGFFQNTFVAGLLLFWLCIYHGLRQTERHWCSFYFPKLFLVGVLYMPVLNLTIWQKVGELNDPTYDHSKETNLYVILAFLVIFSIFYHLYLVYLIMKAYVDLRSMPFFALRWKFMTLLLIILLAVLILVTMYRYGVDLLEDTFVSLLDTRYTSSVEFTAFYGVFNLYVYTMAYVYSPSSSKSHDQSITKDNPTFSMINDSDEDVLYGPDEESRRPLNRGHNDDDSD